MRHIYLKNAQMENSPRPAMRVGLRLDIHTDSDAPQGLPAQLADLNGGSGSLGRSTRDDEGLTLKIDR
jgi:hypothetical protein